MLKTMLKGREIKWYCMYLHKDIDTSPSTATQANVMASCDRTQILQVN